MLSLLVRDGLPRAFRLASVVVCTFSGLVTVRTGGQGLLFTLGAAFALRASVSMR